MTGDRMDFEAQVTVALRELMISALGEAARHGLRGDHHFYITYNTDHDGVRMPDSLRALYPETITIVLQHEFWELEVGDEGFSVSLAFDGVPHNLAVPFDAVTGFADPGVNFSIQLNGPRAGGAPAPAIVPQAETRAETDGGGRDDKLGEVVTLDTFRKK